MRVAIIDADLISRKKHRFPNLACMKISGYYKAQGHEVNLLTSYDEIENYDRVFISKVFKETPVPDGILNLSWVEYGGTGFYYDDAPPLPPEIEHHMPDYHLYDTFIEVQTVESLARFAEGEAEKRAAAVRKIRREFYYYLNYSIGFTTRGCIRGCSFCVNRKCTVCLKHSPIKEFLDADRKYICLLDDNVFACKDWKLVFSELQETGKRFQFKQGLDERLLTEEKCETLFSSKWIGDYIFAFDNLADRRLIEKKLKLLRRYTDKPLKFYTFCAFNHDAPDTYPEDFWQSDIADLFERIRILSKYKCLSYVMRYEDYLISPYKGMYITITRWCNQPSHLKKQSFREFCRTSAANSSPGALRYATEFEQKHPDIAKEYFDMKWSDAHG